VVADIVGVSGRAMLEKLIAGQRDAGVLADLAQRRLRNKIPELTEALTGRFTDHHAFLARTFLDLIDQNTAAIENINARIEVVIAPFAPIRDLLISIPGVAKTGAEVIIAETGADMTKFPTARHLASWAGTCPGSNESAGRVKSTKTRPGNPYLKGALGTAAMSATRSKNTYLAAKYRRIASRRGPMKAIVAVERSMLIAIWHMLTDATFYQDPGADYFTRLKPERAKNRAVDQLRQLGYNVELTEVEPAVA
jgi:transposase